VCEVPGCLSEQPHHVEVPHGKRPCDGDGLERLRWEMGLSSMELAHLAAAYDVLGVYHRCGLVKSLSKSLCDKRSQACVMSTRVGMDLA
jgi:hypothetical protein